jgi:hypothetical protein
MKKGYEKEVNAKVRRMSKIIGKGKEFKMAKLQLLDLYRAGIYAGIKIMSAKK